MVLLNAVVKILALADPDRLQSTSQAVLRSMCRIAGNNGFPVGLASVDDDAIGTAITLQRLSKEALGCRQIPMLAEMEFDRVADAVDGSVEIHPSSADLDVGFIDMPFSGDGALAPIEALQEQRREMNDPAVDRRMIDADTALGYRFLEITQAQSVRQIPTNAKQNDRLVVTCSPKCLRS